MLGVLAAHMADSPLGSCNLDGPFMRQRPVHVEKVSHWRNAPWTPYVRTIDASAIPVHPPSRADGAPAHGGGATGARLRAREAADAAVYNRTIRSSGGASGSGRGINASSAPLRHCGDSLAP